MAITIGTDFYKTMMDTMNSSATNSAQQASLSRITKDASDEELMAACRSFESYFIEQMYKGMEKTIMRDDDNEENDYVSYFKDTLYQQYADKTVESGGLGIAQILFESMKKNQGI